MRDPHFTADAARFTVNLDRPNFFLLRVVAASSCGIRLFLVGASLIWMVPAGAGAPHLPVWEGLPPRTGVRIRTAGSGAGAANKGASH